MSELQSPKEQVVGISADEDQKGPRGGGLAVALPTTSDEPVASPDGSEDEEEVADLPEASPLQESLHDMNMTRSTSRLSRQGSQSILKKPSSSFDPSQPTAFEDSSPDYQNASYSQSESRLGDGRTYKKKKVRLAVGAAKDDEHETGVVGKTSYCNRCCRVLSSFLEKLGKFWARRLRIFVIWSSLYELWSMGIWLGFLTEPEMANTLRWVLLFDAACNSVFLVDTTFHLLDWILERQARNEKMQMDKAIGRKMQASNALAASLKEKFARQLWGLLPKLLLALTMYPVQFAIDWMLVNQDYPYWMVPAVLAIRMSRVGWASVDSIGYINRKELEVYVDIRIQGNVGSSRGGGFQVVMKQFLMVLFWGHWVGCLFYSLRILSKSSLWLQYLSHSRGVPRSESGLRDYFQKFSQEADVISYQVGVGFGTSYMVALYRGFTWNFEDLVPERPEELLMELVVSAGLVAIKSYCIGSFFKFHSKREMETQLFNELMESVSSYMELCELPPSLKKTVIQHFAFQQEKRREAQTLEVLSSLPLEVQKKLREEEYMPLVIERNSNLFSGLSDDFCMQVCLLLKSRFMQPAETIFLEGDAPRELVFLETGSAALSRYTQVGQGKATETLMRYLRSERKEDPTVLGDASFLLEKSHLYSARVRAGMDAVILYLSKASFDENLVAPYPEQYDLLLRNMAGMFFLDLHGDDVAAIGKEKVTEHEGEHFQAMQEEVRRHLLQRQDSLNASFTYAASSGDADLVQTILAKRVSPNTSDYDGRSAMHLASSEGMTECLKVILQSKGDANQKDRWGSTPLQDALNGGFLGTCKLLRSYGGDLGLEDPAGILCSCASAGDTPRMQQLLDYRVDVNSGDYDLRTALHLAATEGRLTVVSFLVAHGADVNVKDRWNSTPLEDAIRNGFKTVAHHLRTHGGRVDAEFAANLLCDAASTGNLTQLQMLVQNGVDSNLFDYDVRTAVHLAAAEGQLLALNFLVNVANANHSPLDRWESSPLQDALAGGHDMCTHLLLAEGAVLGPSATEEDKKTVTDIRSVWFKDGGSQFWTSVNALRSQIANHIAQVERGRARSDIFDSEAAMKFNRQMLNKQICSLQPMSQNAAKLEACLSRLDEFGVKPMMHMLNLLNSGVQVGNEAMFWSRFHTMVYHKKHSQAKDAQMRVFDQVMLGSMGIAGQLTQVVDTCIEAIMERLDRLQTSRVKGPRVKALCSTPRGISETSPTKKNALPSHGRGQTSSSSPIIPLPQTPPAFDAHSIAGSAASGNLSNVGGNSKSKKKKLKDIPHLSEVIMEEVLSALGWNDQQGGKGNSDGLLRALESFGSDSTARLTEYAKKLESLAGSLLPIAHLSVTAQRGVFKEWMGVGVLAAHKTPGAYSWSAGYDCDKELQSLASWCHRYSHHALSGVGMEKDHGTSAKEVAPPPITANTWQTLALQPVLPQRLQISHASTSNLPTPLASVRLSNRSMENDEGEVTVIHKIMDSFEHRARAETRRRLVVTELVLAGLSVLLMEGWEKSQDAKRQDRAAAMAITPFPKAKSKADQGVPPDTFEQLAHIFQVAAKACAGRDVLTENHKKQLIEDARQAHKDAKAEKDAKRKQKAEMMNNLGVSNSENGHKDEHHYEVARKADLAHDSKEDEHIQMAKIFGSRGDLDPEELALLIDFDDQPAIDSKTGTAAIIGRTSSRQFAINLLRWILNHDERQKAVLEEMQATITAGSVERGKRVSYKNALFKASTRDLISQSGNSRDSPPSALANIYSAPMSPKSPSSSPAGGPPSGEPCAFTRMSDGKEVGIPFDHLDLYKEVEEMQEQASEGKISGESGMGILPKYELARRQTANAGKEGPRRTMSEMDASEQRKNYRRGNVSSATGFTSMSSIFGHRSELLHSCLQYIRKVIGVCGKERQKQRQRQRIARRFKELDEDGEGVGVVEVSQVLGVAFHHTLGQDQELRCAHRIFEFLEKDEIGELVTLTEFLSVLPQLEAEVQDQERKKMRMNIGTGGQSGKLMKIFAWMVIPPDAYWLWYWDFVKISGAIYYMMEVPVYFCFPAMDGLDGFLWYANVGLNGFFDCFMACNVVLNFFRSFLHPTRGFVTHFQEIRINYLLNFFFVDLLACLPIDLVVSFEKMKSRTFIGRPHALARLVRLFHMRQLLFNDDLSTETASEKRRKAISAGFVTTAWGLLKLVCAMIHFMSCVWWYLGSRYDSFDPSGVLPTSTRASWIFGYNAVENETAFGAEDGSTPFWWQYSISFYWSVGRIVQAGTPGEMFPGSTPELAWCCILFLFSFAISGYVDGILAGKVMTGDEGAIETLATKRIVDDYLQTVELPHELSEQIRSTAGATVAAQQSRRSEDVQKQLPHILKQKIARRAFTPYFEKSEAFKHCSTNFLVEIGTCCKVIQVGKGSLLASVGEPASRILVLYRGRVSFVDRQGATFLETARTGEMIGDIEVLFDIKHEIGARAVEESKLVTLSRSDFHKVALLYPTDRMALQRGMIEVLEGQTEEAAHAVEETQVQEEETKSAAPSASSAGSHSSGVSSLHSLRQRAYGAELHRVREKTDAELSDARQSNICHLIDMAAAGNAKRVEEILTGNDVHVDEGDYDQRTALHLAVCNGHLEVVTSLVDKYNASLIVKDRFGNMPLDDAVREKRVEVAKYLIDRQATFKTDADLAGILCTAGHDNDLETLNLLRGVGVEPNAADYDGRTAIHLGASMGHVGVVELLLSQESIHVNPHDRFGNTPLDDAIRHQHSEVRKLLQTKGGEMGDAQLGVQLCALGAANDVPRLRELSETGVNMSQGDYDARTGLHLAASEGKLEACAFLLNEAKVDPNLLDRFLNTPLDDAVRHQHIAIESLLRQAGGLRGSDPKMAQEVVAFKKNLEIEAEKKATSRIDREMKSTDVYFLETGLNRFANHATFEDDMNTFVTHAAVFRKLLVVLLRQSARVNEGDNEKDDPRLAEAREARAHLERLLDQAMKGMESSSIRLEGVIDLEFLPWVTDLSANQARLLQLFLPGLKDALVVLRDYLRTRAETGKIVRRLWVESAKSYQCAPLGLLMHRLTDMHMADINEARLDAVASLWIAQGPKRFESESEGKAGSLAGSVRDSKGKTKKNEKVKDKEKDDKAARLHKDEGGASLFTSSAALRMVSYTFD